MRQIEAIVVSVMVVLMLGAMVVQAGMTMYGGGVSVYPSTPPISITTTPVTINNAQMVRGVVNNSGATQDVSANLALAVPGNVITFKTSAAYYITIKPNTSDVIVLAVDASPAYMPDASGNNHIMVAGDAVKLANVAGTQITLGCDKSGYWTIYGLVGRVYYTAN